MSEKDDNSFAQAPPRSEGEEEFYAGAERLSASQGSVGSFPEQPAEGSAGASYRNLNATGKTQSQPAAFTEAERAAYEMGRQDGFGVCLELWERTTNFTVKERDEFIKMGRKFLAELKQTGEKE